MNARVQFGLLGWLVLCHAVQAQQWQEPAGIPSSPQAITPVGWNHMVPSAHAGSGHPGAATLAQTEYELLPNQHSPLYNLDSRLDLSLLEVVRGSWIRLEYMNAEIDNGAGTTLGAPLANVPNVARQFRVERPTLVAPDPTNAALPITMTTQVPETGGIQWDDLNGIRGTVGIPLTKKLSVEGTFWGLEVGSDAINLPTIPPTTFMDAHALDNTFLFATTLTRDGVPLSTFQSANLDPITPDFATEFAGTATVIVYDQAFFSEYTIDTWSTDVNLVYDLRIPHDGWKLQSLVGYRHTEYGENLAFGGTFANNSNDPFFVDVDPAIVAVEPYFMDLGIITAFDPAISNRIQSKTRNFRHELQVGLRSELSHKFFSVGVEPKVALGGNLIRSQVSVSENVRAPGDALGAFDPLLAKTDVARTTTDRSFEFSPTIDLGVYANVNLTSWFKLRFGYNLIWLGRLGVADQSIRFNEVTDPLTGLTAGDIVVEPRLRDRVISAVSVGGEIILP